MVMTTSSPQSLFPNAVRHSLIRPDGKKLSYCTFQTQEESSKDASSSQPAASSTRHPVLYLHGFPGSALEGALCASQVEKEGGILYALDRPGCGYSDAIDETDTDKYLTAVCNIVWDMVSQLSWTSFSLLGVSGGGPFALALLDSYLKNPTKATLTNVVIVAGIYCPAGVEGMMSTNVKLTELVAQKDRRWNQFQLWCMFSTPRLLSKLLPGSILLKAMPTKDLPPPDEEIMTDPAIGNFMLDSVKLSLRQGSSTAVREACILFQTRPCEFESSLRNYLETNEPHPRITLFHGLQDVNVPSSHSRYVHKYVLGESQATLMKYEDLGHVSLVVRKAQEYARSAVHNK